MVLGGEIMAVKKKVKDKKIDGEYYLEIDGESGYKFVGDLKEELDAIMEEDNYKIVNIYKLHAVAKRKPAIYDIEEV